MAIPGVRGVLELNVGDVEYQTRVRPDGLEVQLQALGRKDGLNITVFLQRVDFSASPEKCRDAWWPGTKDAVKLKRDDLQENVIKNGMARVEYIIPEFQGMLVRQKSIHAYLGNHDLCVEVHLSKVEFRPTDLELFEQVLSTVRLDPERMLAQEAPQTETNSSSPVMTLLAQGSRAYTQQDYATASIYYQKALDMEKRQRTLSHNYFRVLVDNLAMSYGISGKLKETEETLNYGISQDPEYPLFYYNMACVFGEKGEMDNALAQLRTAYKYKAHMIEGEDFPDPLKDDSFRNFFKDPKFVNAVHGMQK
jgi:tetratricopeptide (TPR) repeat protein